jgi:hypothetical protein
VDVGQADRKPIQLDVTETTIVAQHFDARYGQSPNGDVAPGPANVENGGWGNWINRLNAALRWDRWTAGLRLDSAVYWLRPADRQGYGTYPGPPALPGGPPTVIDYTTLLKQDNETRFRNSIYPAKLWVTYASPGLEVTAGDSYVQFGRGLTLSMRKIDELGIDTTVRGAKVQFSQDPFSLTLVGGLANPSRVDEATGRALFVTSNLTGGDPQVPVFGSDRVVGIDMQAGRGLPVTLSTHAVRFTRCAPYHYQGSSVASSVWTDPAADSFNPGTCDPADTRQWLIGSSSLNPVPRGLQAHDITMAGQSLELPDLWGHGKLYVEAAVQQRQSDAPSASPPNGNALYAALTVDAGITNTTLELKSNRNFYTVAGSVSQKAPEFAIVAYSFLPPAESFNMLDAEGTGDFNACVEGARLREDVSPTKDLMVYGQGVLAYSQTEQPSGACDAQGHTINSSGPASAVQDKVYDGVGGFEYYFDDHLSHAFVSVGARDDTLESGDFQYREHHLEYSIAKYIAGPWSVEVQGRHRHRKEVGFNQDPNTYDYGWWFEGENYVAVRMAPKWVFTQGFEYTTLIGQPLLYFNGAVLYKFTSSSNVRVFVGEQRGAFRCASGICRFFPPFEGARAELTLRF